MADSAGGIAAFLLCEAHLAALLQLLQGWQIRLQAWHAGLTWRLLTWAGG